MRPTAKLRGAAMETRVEDEKLNPRPLERRVGRVDEATTPGTQGFGSSPLLSGATQRDVSYLHD